MRTALAAADGTDGAKKGLGERYAITINEVLESPSPNRIAGRYGGRLAGGIRMSRPEIILQTFEQVATVCGDPREAVYARLFAARPHLEALFVMDTDGGVRGSMLQQSLECLIDFAGARISSPGLLASERQRHEGYGVCDETFVLFFEVIRDTFREALAASWTDAMETAWDSLLEDLRAVR